MPRTIALSPSTFGALAKASQQADALSRPRNRRTWGGEFLAQPPESLGSGVLYGSPTAPHNTGTAATYSLTDRTGAATGSSVEDVWNDTGQTLQPSVSHIIVSVNGGKLAFPFQLADCSSWSNVT